MSIDISKYISYFMFMTDGIEHPVHQSLVMERASNVCNHLHQETGAGWEWFNTGNEIEFYWDGIPVYYKKHQDLLICDIEETAKEALKCIPVK